MSGALRESLSVLVIDGKGELPLMVAWCLARVPNISLHILSDGRASQDPVRFSRYKSSYSTLQTDNDTQRLELVCQAVERTGADIVMAIREPMVRFVSAHSEALREIAAVPPTPRLDVLGKVVNKWQLAAMLKEHGFPCPPTIPFTAVDELEQSLGDLSFPILLKPVRGQGGEHIQCFDNPAALLACLNANPGFSNKYIVQSYINGYDVSCSVLCRNGQILAYTIHKGLIPRRFAYSKVIQFTEDPQVFDLVERLMSTLEWSGIANLDFRYDEGDGLPKLVDVNARYWSTLLGSLSVGVNFPHLACLAALDSPFPRPKFRLEPFVLSEIGVMQKLKYYLRRSNVKFGFGQTHLKYILTDPIPVASGTVWRVWQVLTSRFRTDS